MVNKVCAQLSVICCTGLNNRLLSVQAGELPAAILPIDGVDKGGQLVGVDSLKDVGKQKVSTG